MEVVKRVLSVEKVGAGSAKGWINTDEIKYPSIFLGLILFC